jgi:hypothetical protein
MWISPSPEVKRQAIQVAGQPEGQAIQVAGGRLSRSRVAPRQAIQVAGQPERQAIQVAGRAKSRLSRSRVEQKAGYPGRGSSEGAGATTKTPLFHVIFEPPSYPKSAPSRLSRSRVVFLSPCRPKEKRRFFLPYPFYPYIYPFKDLILGKLALDGPVDNYPRSSNWGETHRLLGASPPPAPPRALRAPPGLRPPARHPPSNEPPQSGGKNSVTGAPTGALTPTPICTEPRTSTLIKQE